MFWQLVGTLLFLGLVKLTVMIYHQMTYWKKRGVKTTPIMPILGSGYEIFLGTMSLPAVVTNMYNAGKGKRYVGTMDFFKPSILIRDPELIKDITVKSFESFPNHQQFVDEDTDPLFGKNLFALKDDRWKEMRTFLSPAFTANKMKIMCDLLVTTSREFVSVLEKDEDIQKNFEAKDAFTRYANDVIASIAFGITVNSIEDRENEFYLRGKKATKFNTFDMLKLLLVRVLPKPIVKTFSSFFFSRENSIFFVKIIEETVRMRVEKGIVRPDMIHQLLQARAKNENITIVDIVAQGFVFFFAGFETVAVFISYIAYELAFNPDIQEKLREEIDRCMDDANDQLNYEMISKMTYLDMVTSETLRKYSPSPMTDRVCKKPFTIKAVNPDEKDIVVGVDTVITIPTYAIHHDPEYFPDPDKFDPERFNEENKDKLNPYTYMPFGVGPRMCIANRFALMEGKILITNLLRKFVLKPHEKARMPVEFSKKNLTMALDDGYWIKLEPRRND